MQEVRNPVIITPELTTYSVQYVLADDEGQTTAVLSTIPICYSTNFVYQYSQIILYYYR
jgi:hypothetical protein